jgi:hypothetical protein
MQYTGYIDAVSFITGAGVEHPDSVSVSADIMAANRNACIAFFRLIA